MDALAVGRRRDERAAYAALLALGALDAAGYGVIAPVLPRIADQVDAGPALIGLLVASFPVAMMLAFSPAGYGIKRGHLQLVLIVSLLVSAVGAAGFIFGSTLAVFFAGRALMGLGSGGLWMAVTMGTLARWPGQEYVCMSRVFAAYAAGGLLGPSLGAIGGIRPPFLAYLGLLALGAVAAQALRGTASGLPFRQDRSALKLPGFWLASAGILFAVVAMGVSEGVLPLHFAEKLGQTEIGGLYIATALIAAGSAAAASAFGPRLLLVTAIVLVVTGIGIAGASSAIPMWLVALVITGVGNGIANTGSMGILIESVPTERIITALVVWSQFSVVGYLLGPVLGGSVSEAVGFDALGIVPFVVALPLLVLLVASRARGAAPITGAGATSTSRR